MIGQTIGDRLEIVRMLGSGGMGEVYVALHIELDVNRAVKVMRADLVSSSQAEARFKRALVNQITAILMELCDHLHLYLSDAQWVAKEIDAIERAEESVTDLAIEKALVDSRLEDATGEKPEEEASFRYRQRQLREHVKYMTHGLTQRYMSLYDEVMACRPQVSDPAILSRYEEMEGLIDRYLQLLSDQRGRT